MLRGEGMEPLMDAVKIAREGRVATVSFDRGDGANALSSGLMEALTDAARELDRDGQRRIGASSGSMMRSRRTVRSAKRKRGS